MCMYTPACTPACSPRGQARAPPVLPHRQVKFNHAQRALPARYFYDSLVACAGGGPVSRPPKGFPWPGGKPLCFVDCGRDLEVSHGLTGGRSNPEEAALVARIVSDVLAAGLSPSKVAVLAPYARQVVRELPIQPAPHAMAAVQPAPPGRYLTTCRLRSARGCAGSDPSRARERVPRRYR